MLRQRAQHKTAQDLAKRMTALGLHVNENVSLGYCAEIAGMHKEDFVRFIGTFRVSILRYDDFSELEEDFGNA
jgi:predicted HTH domain antitoxin